MTDWRLRRASVEDAPAAALVAGASFLSTFAGILDGADIVAHVARNSAPATFAAWIADPASVVTIAEHPVGAAPVGYSVLTTPDLPVAIHAGDIELRRVYTLPLAQGTGLGATLLQRAVDDAMAMGGKRMLLGVLGRNARARSFYERHGFGIVGHRQYRVGSALCDDVIYARSL